MKLFKKSVAYVLAFITVFSSFTILPSEFWGGADVSAVELTTEEPSEVETNKDEIIVEEPATVETNKDEVVVAQSNAGETYTEGDFTFSIINDNEVELVSYNGTGVHIAIPDVTTGSECSELANKKVTAIGNNAFKEKDLATLTFGKNIVTIGEYAFAYNRYLRTVDLSVCTRLKTIGEYAFYENNKIKDLKFPNSLEVISPYAFYRCYCIEKLAIGTNIKRIGKKSFYGCTYLSILNIKGGNHAVIEDYAFYRCSYMDKLTIGDGVEIIGKGAFEWNDWLSDITIGNTVTTIKHRAIQINSITQMTIGTGLTTLEKEAIYCDNFEYRYGDGETGMVEADIKIYSENITTCSPNSFPQCDDIYFPYQIRLYCYKDSVTHKTLDARECGNVIKFLEPPYHVLGIKVNGVFLDNFNENKKRIMFMEIKLILLNLYLTEPV